ncbi:hypothetical protein [Sedimenticola selenatireducens]|uniref:Uncharacterized protein n=1 Tax=Sedimenticola selenatireducens TaxID=191960 RepID=A0A557S0L5_9GAMM|nr:hypothetical protein [Sedimenticola selenatireducens]TVO70972.1 hypothetical protein FHP88_16105 [Sedimenticola selenatireducens]TVT65838.1 MAG: hypothetical protein FHK78_03795 [Sedimenticola selenatireducens]
MTKVAILIIIALIIVAGIYTEMQRGNNLAATAKRLGFDFTSGLQRMPAEWEALGFDLLLQGQSEIGNRMTGMRSGRAVEVFDYSFDATAAGEGFKKQPAIDDQVNIERRNQTVVRVQSAVVLPDFDISPASSHMRNVAQRFGFAPLMLQENRAFSQAYNVLVADAVRCRALFIESVQQFFMSHPDLVVEARGRDLLVYRFEKRLKAKDIEGFLQEVDELVRLLESMAGTT